MAQKETARTALEKRLTLLMPPLEVARGMRHDADSWLSNPGLPGHFISDDVSEGVHDRSTLYFFTDEATRGAFIDRWITVH